LSAITKPFLPTVNAPAVQRNPAHWPEQVQGFLDVGYGGRKTREAEEQRRDPSGQEHAPPHYCYKLAAAWCDRIDEFESAYFLMPRGSFRDSALDRSAKNLTPKGGAA
jgi:hypothetical protein